MQHTEASHTKDYAVVDLEEEMQGNVFENNIAPYGADFASFPDHISYFVAENESGSKINATDKTLTLAAGQTFELDMTIIDREGRVYNDENQAVAKIEFTQG